MVTLVIYFRSDVCRYIFTSFASRWMLKTIELEIPAPFVDIVIELKPIMTAIYLSQRKNSVFSKTKWAGIALEFISVV